MESNVKELKLEDMEQVNGGTILGLICVIGLVGSAIGLACGLGYATRDT